MSLTAESRTELREAIDSAKRTRIVRSRVTRAQLVAEYRALLGQGLTIREVAERYGKAYSSVANVLADPDGAAQRRRRKRYQGECIDCGARTDGSNGRAEAPERCQACRKRFEREQRYWTRERVIAAIQRWAVEHEGEPPRVTDWIRAGRNREHPSFSNVYRTEQHWTAPFASWSEALEAAGFPGHTQGTRRMRNRESWLANLTASHRRRFAHARDYGEPYKLSILLGADQVEALRALHGPPFSEHLRRAVDAYLAIVQPTAEDVGKPLGSAEGSD